MTLVLMLLLKSLLVFALSGVVLLCLRRASASARHLVCLLTLSALLALPLFSLTLPAWHVAALTTARDAEPTPVRPSPIRSNPLADTLPKGEGKEFKQEAHSVPAASSSASASASASASFPLGRTPAKQGGGFFTQEGGFLIQRGLFFFYLLGLLLASTRPLLGLWGIVHLRRACAAVTDAPTLGMAADCAAALRLSRLPLFCQAGVPVPMTWGGRRPVVLLPSGSEGWPEDRLRSVLVHEMAHIKRRDWACHRLADLACAVYWFHPLVWLTARRLRSESEVACDDLVLSSGIAAPEYARHLLEIAGALSRPLPSQSAIAMAQTPHIKRRILMILDTAHSRRTVTRRALLIALIPSAAALLTLSALRPSVKAQAPAAVAGGIVSPVTVPIGGYPLQLRFGNSTAVQMDNRSGQPSLIMSSGVTINGTTLFAGVSNPHSDGNKWWSATGTFLPTPIYDTAAASHAYQGPNIQNVEIAFRLPPSAQGVTVQYKLAQSTSASSDGAWPGKLRDDAGLTESQMFASTDGARIVSASFPPTLKKTNVQVGIASGAWKTVIIEPKTPGAVEPFGGLSTAVGGSLFILSVPDATTKGLLLPVATNMADNINDIRIIAVGNQGQTLFPTNIGDESSGSGASSLNQIKAYFSQPVSQIKEFRVQTRPFQWIEFKNVALQPIK